MTNTENAHKWLALRIRGLDKPIGEFTHAAMPILQKTALAIYGENTYPTGKTIQELTEIIRILTAGLEILKYENERINK